MTQMSSSEICLADGPGQIPGCDLCVVSRAATESIPAVQTIHHNGQHPSRVRLPVIPA